MDQLYRLLKIKDREYPLVFTTQAFIDVARRYGGLKEMAEKLDALDACEAADEYAWLIALLANQGIEIENEENGGNAAPITEKQVKLYLKPALFADAKIAFMAAVSDGMKRETETDFEQELDPDDEDEVLAEVKNAGGAAAK